MTKTLEITVDKDGKLTIKQAGISGPACLKDYEKWLALLKENGVDLPKAETQKTPEFYKTSVSQKQTVSA